MYNNVIHKSTKKKPIFTARQKRQKKRDIIVLIMLMLFAFLMGMFVGKVSTKPKIEYIEVPVKAETTQTITEKYIGEFEITAYCPCVRCCGKSDGITATGTIATEGRTIAVDPSIIPYGSIVVIDGEEYIAEDCGGAIKNKRIDIFFESHQDALEYGRQRKTVYIREYIVSTRRVCNV